MHRVYFARASDGLVWKYHLVELALYNTDVTKRNHTSLIPGS